MTGPQHLPGESVERCPLRYVVTVRVTTFYTREIEGATNGREHWETQLALAFADADPGFAVIDCAEVHIQAIAEIARQEDASTVE